jgi:hypothetical protein
MRSLSYVVIFAVVFGLGLLASLGLSHVPNAERALRAAENVGVENPVVIKRSPAWGVLGGCHENDITKFTVRGTNRTVVVCAPLIGGFTVRA